ncbi:hypothetical protein [Oxobacter pfennigii]|nr:hypothetical protein [Oxobacter pfennigii]
MRGFSTRFYTDEGIFAGQILSKHLAGSLEAVNISKF